jgi:hypothetical protein
MERWVADFGLFSIRIHHWMASDDDRNFHDHPWWFITLVLKGSYTDMSPKGDFWMKPGYIRFRPAIHRHTVLVSAGGCCECYITLEPRPHYCDRGNWIAKVFPSGKLARDLDDADGWPRYFFDEARAKLEIEAWLKKRGQ